MQGETSMMFSNLVAALPHLSSGRFRALGVSSLKRSTLAPQIPTVAESGLPGYEVLQYYSLVAPAGTPEPIIRRLADEITRHFATPDTQRQLAAEGTEVSVAPPETLAQIHSREIARWSALIARLGISQD
jgi:tripartite-type tricarboxylate transporter receptor subunit TctC